MDAAINGHINVVSLLIERGTKLSLKNDEVIRDMSDMLISYNYRVLLP